MTGKETPLWVWELAIARGREVCRTVHWREGSRGRQGSRFGAVRVRTAHRHTQGDPPGDEQWLVYEWPAEEKEPTKFWFSTLPADTSLKQLVRLAKLRWRGARDCPETRHGN